MTTHVALHSTVHVTEQQVSCDLEGDLVILNLTDGAYFELNPVGARIWELMREGRSLVEVREALLQEYDIDEERCTADLLALVAELATANLVQVLD
jgi:hypothetical protein